MPRDLLVKFWTNIERDELRKLFNQGWSVPKIARRLKRSYSGVRREMMLLGLSMRERAARSQPRLNGNGSRPKTDRRQPERMPTLH